MDRELRMTRDIGGLRRRVRGLMGTSLLCQLWKQCELLWHLARWIFVELPIRVVSCRKDLIRRLLGRWGYCRRVWDWSGNRSHNRGGNWSHNRSYSGYWC